MRAAQSNKNILVLGDINVDHNNPLHKLAKEANDLLAVTEAANMRHLSNQVPTWKSYGLQKVCKCVSCNCLKQHRTSSIDNKIREATPNSGSNCSQKRKPRFKNCLE